MDVTPDAIPVISPANDPADDLAGLFIATGFSGHGFGIGPGAGRLMADLVTGSASVVDPSDFACPRQCRQPRKAEQRVLKRRPTKKAHRAR